VPAAKQSEVADALGSGSAASALHGLDPAQAKQVQAAGSEAFVYALGHAMTVSGFLALLGAAIGAVAIRAKRRGVDVKGAEASLSPQGEPIAAREAAAAVAAD
jgi:hypothetical protein